MMQVCYAVAHKNDIKAIKYITLTDVPMLMTASLDKTVRIWELQKAEDGSGWDLVLKGKLMQGYLALENYVWDFPLKNISKRNE